MKSLKRVGYLADSFNAKWSLSQSRGSWLYNVATKEKYLDFHCGYGSLPLGWNHPSLAEKLKVVVNKPANGDFYTQELQDFVETFQNIMVPSKYKRELNAAPLFFIDGGAAANDNALKVAMDYKVQKTGTDAATKIMHLKNAFHGRGGYTLSLTNTDPHKVKRFAKFTDWPRIETNGTDQEILDRIAQNFVTGNDKIAALIVEPIQCEGGDRHLSSDLLLGMQELCREFDALFIVDEVQTGFGSTGKRWCFEHINDLQPDIVTFGKKSQQCGLFTGPKATMLPDNCLQTSGRISSTWSGNLADIIRSTHIIRIIKDEKLINNAQARGEQFLDTVCAWEKLYPGLVQNVRGKGVVLAFDTPNRDQFLATLYNDHKLLALGCGPNSIRLRPNLAVTQQEMDECLTRIQAALNNLK